MSRNSKTSAAQQLKFVMECRKSGKTDAQWCIENGIRPATFYNWVSRLRTLRCEIFFCKFRSSMIIDAA